MIRDRLVRLDSPTGPKVDFIGLRTEVKKFRPDF